MSLIEGMKIIMPIYRAVSWIPALKNISNKLTVLRKEERNDKRTIQKDNAERI